jgi:hypothetical protein
VFCPITLAIFLAIFPPLWLFLGQTQVFQSINFSNVLLSYMNLSGKRDHSFGGGEMTPVYG